MTTSTFQTTIGDYLRVIFHRIWYIVFTIGLTLAVAVVWLYGFAPRIYRSELSVLVYSQDLHNPQLTRIKGQEPLRPILNTIRERLRVEERLRYLACNLRYAVKRETWESIREEGSRAALLDEENPLAWREALRAELTQLEEGVRVNGTRIRFREFAGYIDTQGLARILGVGRDVGDELTDRVILAPRPGTGAEAARQRDPFTWELRHLLISAGRVGEEADTDTVRLEAERLLLERLSAGAGAFDRAGALALLKESWAIERLAALGLYTCVHDLHSGGGAGLSAWVERLKTGLQVSTVYGNQITFGYRAPAVNTDDIITHLVARVAFAMVEAEYRASAEEKYRDVDIVLQQQKTKLQAELNRLNRELYNFSELSSLQLSMIGTPQEPIPAGRVPVDPPRDPYWSDPFLGGLPRASTHIHRMNNLVLEKQEIEKQIAGLQERENQLQRQIRDPDKRTIRVTRSVRKGDRPEIVQLKQNLAQKEVELSKLLKTSTEAHPFVKELRREIEQTSAALRALERPGDEPSAEVVEKTNPEIEDWKSDLAAVQEEIQEYHGRMQAIDRLLLEERRKAKEAVERQQAYQEKLKRLNLLQADLQRVLEEEESLRSKRSLEQEFRPVFEVRSSASKPGRPDEPKVLLVMFMALLIGGLAATTAVFLAEYMDHSLKTEEDVKRHLGIPVLGTIPEFGLVGLERFVLRLEGHRGHRRERFPKTLDEEQPLPLAEREKIKGRKPMKAGGLLLVLILIGLLVGIFFLARPQVERLIDRIGGYGGGGEMEETIPTGGEGIGSLPGGAAGETATMGRTSTPPAETESPAPDTAPAPGGDATTQGEPDERG